MSAFYSKYPCTDDDWMIGGMFYVPSNPICHRLMMNQALDDLPENLDLMEEPEEEFSSSGMNPLFTEICDSFFLVGAI